jgi:hypothetical protein
LATTNGFAPDVPWPTMAPVLHAAVTDVFRKELTGAGYAPLV